MSWLDSGGTDCGNSINDCLLILAKTKKHLKPDAFRKTKT
jgi:hypothetical protein